MTDNHSGKNRDKKQALLVFLPLGLVLMLAGLFAVTILSEGNRKEIRSVLIGQPAPPLRGDLLLPPRHPLDRQKPTVVNFFASWCVPCQAEHASLVRLSQSGMVNLVGIPFQDDPAESRRFLARLGNPFDRVLLDPTARLAIGFGVAGVPETYVIDRGQILRYRYWGPIVGDGLETRLLPEIERWR